MQTQHDVNRVQLFAGGALVALGLLFLAGTLLNIDVGALCWPIALIVLGVFLVARPRMAPPGMDVDVRLLGDIKRRGSFPVASQEVWLGVADVDLDLTQATFPPGETVLRVYSFVGDVDILAPKSVGVAVRANGFLVETNLLGQKQERFLTPVQVASADYAAAEHRLRIEMTGFVIDLKVRQV